jgi:hypothetical protein
MIISTNEQGNAQGRERGIEPEYALPPVDHTTQWEEEHKK